MRGLLLVLLLGSGIALGAHGDPSSGPSRTTIQRASWGTLYYEPAKGGACQLEPTSDGFRFTSSEGEVGIQGSEANGYRLTWGRESLTITAANGGGGLDLHLQDRQWSLRTMNGDLTVTASSPKALLLFTRINNGFAIKGSQGTVRATTEWGNLKIESPLGLTTVTLQNGKRVFAGPALDQIPYLGRGLFIAFHGVGVFLDLTRFFPMPEVAEWLDWKPIAF
jgi:hypothetical protein